MTTIGFYHSHKKLSVNYIVYCKAMMETLYHDIMLLGTPEESIM